ncbi:MAG: N-6 DNA methylase, partial [Rhodothermaceae bacterium]|nr:N-6 DNA methylase [Rhodothermaceae bacterium]
MPKRHITEKNAYAYINSTLKHLGWDTRNPNRYPEAQVYTDNQALGHPELKKGLGTQRPENIVKVTETKFWVIEAKSTRSKISQAIREAEGYANDINTNSVVEAVMISGVAGNDDEGYLIKSRYSNKGHFEDITNNGEALTGLLSPEVASRVVSENKPDLQDLPINEEVFLSTAETVNRDLHLGAINKNERARVIAALLLALVDDTLPNVDANPTILIKDINARAEEVLKRNGKANFFPSVQLSLPPSTDNHAKFRRALVNTMQALMHLNIRSTMFSGTDLLGKFYEVFLKYGNGAKEIGIVLTPRHITRFAAEILDVGSHDVVCDPACGTGGFLIAALDHVKTKHALPNSPQVEVFKKHRLFGIDQDPIVTALAIVNMIFRNDGRNHIAEGNCFLKYLKTSTRDKHTTAKLTKDRPEEGEEGATKVLMNPPFALQRSDEKEYLFVQHGLDLLQDGCLLFSVLPISTMFESGEVREWRANQLLKHNTLLSVITFPPELFYPVSVHTLGVVIKKGSEHPKHQQVFWLRAVRDGYVKIKGKR